MINYLTKEKIKTREKFFDDNFISEAKNTKKISLIVVSHVIDTGVPYINILNKYFSIECIIPKKKSINKIFLELYPKNKILNITREELKDISVILPIINNIPKDNNLVIVDIGGYFSNISSKIKEVLGERFLGVIEDTENGHQKYLNKGLNHPVLSVARSPLKENEDHLVGQAVVFSVDALFRELGILLNNKKVGIIGFGKIGNGILSSLRDKGCDVSVYDINPITLIHAYSRGNKIVTKNILLEISDVIFCSSGNLSLKDDEYKLLKNNVFIASVTSSDDELDLKYLKDNYSKLIINDYITRYEKNTHSVYVINDGNAVNFLHGAVVDDFILLVQKEIIDSIVYMNENTLDSSVQKTSELDRIRIADLWLKYFLLINI